MSEVQTGNGTPASTWTTEDLLRALRDDDATDISEVPDRALRDAITIAQTNGMLMALAALEHENGRRGVLSGAAAPAEPAPLPLIEHAVDLAASDSNVVKPYVYNDTFMLPSEISLQSAVEIEAFLNELGDAKLNAADGSISYTTWCDDLWEACATAHEVVAELQSHGIEAAVDRDNVRETGQP